MKTDLQLQIEHNDLIDKYNNARFQVYHREPEKFYIDPKHSALELALEIEEKLDLDDPWITLCPGSVHEVLYECVQLLRTLVKDIKSNDE